MYGWSGSATDGSGRPLHAVPFNGMGTFHELNLDISASLGQPPGTTVLPDRAWVVNYTLLPWGRALFVLDPEYTGYRDQTNASTPPAYGSKPYVGRNAPYTYPDLKDFYLA